ncbi:hypothetical protein CROQUDRAFT_652826 [Cronartium quercuum f. sp. fusiforme G11]|uniref:Natural resistance-associated macrophage protein n=1 Tax=Cronartium quercuum f. sp. fusiforme G11 TaxID=708437 RepID=A0A9P6NTU6_9BASI|nr:hypothetical protein CROQUDRAFT_652826 [Cronartium quercuum f. sp. fusiforme G11]
MQQQPDPAQLRTALTNRLCIRSILTRHLRFIGPGILASVAYLDPGNWATDLQAGSTYGYSHLCVILVSSFFAILLQILCTRLGYVTGKDLAQQCRLHLYHRARLTMFWRWGVLYPLYLICEAGIIFTDLAELIGSAMALNMLIPDLPLWAGVLLTSLDVFIVLLAFNSYPSSSSSSSTRIFEAAISLLVLAVFVSFAVLLAKVDPDWGKAFKGFVPSHRMVAGGGLYQAIAIIGATVMPHALFLGSRVAITDRTVEDDSDVNKDEEQDKTMKQIKLGDQAEDEGLAKRVQMQSHLKHASWDLGLSLFTIALPVNAAILILAAAAFSREGGNADETVVADLFSAHSLLRARLGRAAAYIFALALLFSGQAASITVTLAGQIVSEGFLEWRTNPIVRRLVTRLVGIVPAAVVAGAVGVKGMDTLLVGSQVALSLALPFVIGPLLFVTSNHQTMTIDLAMDKEIVTGSQPLLSTTLPANLPLSLEGQATKELAQDNKPVPVHHSFANSRFIIALTLAIMVVVCAANVYAIVQLASNN